MNWLFKEEPSNYSFDAFVKDKKTTWSGVRNPVAQRNLRSVKKGDQVFYTTPATRSRSSGSRRRWAMLIRIRTMRPAGRTSSTSVR